MTKQEALEALGIEVEKDRFFTGLLLGIGAGALLGGALALLLAPKPGVELRQDLNERARAFADRAKERAERARQDARARAAETTEPQ